MMVMMTMMRVTISVRSVVCKVHGISNLRRQCQFSSAESRCTDNPQRELLYTLGGTLSLATAATAIASAAMQHYDQPSLETPWPSSLLLSAQCISGIGQVIKSVCVSVSQSVSQSVSPSHKTSWTLYRSQSSTDLHQTWHQGRVPGDVVTYCFRWKSEIFLSAKPEVELILTIAPMEKYL